MKIDESVLLAYVDQQLAAPERERVEAALMNSEALREQVAALRASCLPYESAFDAQALPPVPPALAAQLDAMVAAAAAPRAQPAPQPSRRLWLATGAAAGLGVLSGWLLRGQQGAGGEPQAWLDAVANYQAMYTRDTLAGEPQPRAGMAEALRKFVQRTGVTALVVPDLSGQGLQLRRVQHLVFRDQLVLQIAYLPKQGKPAALCVTTAAQEAPAAPVQVLELHGMRVATWSAGTLAHAWASDDAPRAATALAEGIRDGRFASLV